jgi:hypothetical protein
MATQRSRRLILFDLTIRHLLPKAMPPNLEPTVNHDRAGGASAMIDHDTDYTPDFEEVPELDFFEDACMAMARNSCILLKAAGEPVTSDNVLRLIRSLPWTFDQAESDPWRDAYFYQLVRRSGTWGNALRDDLYHYFVIHNTRLSSSAHRMREAAFWGVLGGMDWEAALRQPVVARQPLPVVDYQRQLPVPMLAERKWKTIRKPVGFLRRISGISWAERRLSKSIECEFKTMKSKRGRWFQRAIYILRRVIH